MGKNVEIKTAAVEIIPPEKRESVHFDQRGLVQTISPDSIDFKNRNNLVKIIENTPEEYESIKEYLPDLLSRCIEIAIIDQALKKNSVDRICQMGARGKTLYLIRENLEDDTFKGFIAKNAPFGRTTAYAEIAVYENWHKVESWLNQMLEKGHEVKVDQAKALCKPPKNDSDPSRFDEGSYFMRNLHRFRDNHTNGLRMLLKVKKDDASFLNSIKEQLDQLMNDTEAAIEMVAQQGA